MHPIQTEDDVRRMVTAPFLREKRVAAGLTQWEVARFLGYTTPQFISNWERGVSLPPLDALPALARLYRVSRRDFIDMMESYHRQVAELHQRRLEEAFRSFRAAG